MTLAEPSTAGRVPGGMETQDRLQPPALERARGEGRLAFAWGDGATRLKTLYQSGSAKIRLPWTPSGDAPEAVLLNTAGGLTGGDRMTWRVDVEAGAAATVTSQAAERIYRRAAGTAEVETAVTVGPGARLDWLPQETILFDRSALSRRLVVDLDRTATLLAVESFVLGRTAMGETVRDAFVSDAWRVRRDGRLVFADSVRLDGDARAIMAGSATGKGAAAFATLAYFSPDAGAALDTVRAVLDGGGAEGGASAWNGFLVARLLAPTGQALRADLIRLVEALRGSAMPRVWHC